MALHFRMMANAKLSQLRCDLGDDFDIKGNVIRMKICLDNFAEVLNVVGRFVYVAGVITDAFMF